MYLFNFFTQVKVMKVMSTGSEMYPVKSNSLTDISTSHFCAKLTEPHVILI